MKNRKIQKLKSNPATQLLRKMREYRLSEKHTNRILFDLDILLSGISSKNAHKEVFWGGQAGEEGW